MAGYKLLIKRSALKEIESIGSKRDRQQIVIRIQRLATEPRPRGVDKLVGAAGLFRLRHGHYRIIYAIDDDRRAVDVIKVGHRREVYRRND